MSQLLLLSAVGIKKKVYIKVIWLPALKGSIVKKCHRSKKLSLTSSQNVSKINKISPRNSYDKNYVKNFVKKNLGSYHFLSQFWCGRL